MNESGNRAILISGANGNLGKKLIKALQGYPVTALVRSESARQDLEAYCATLPPSPLTICQCDTLDCAAIARAASGCSYAVHLVGIIKESAHNSFERAHIEATSALLNALKNTAVERVFYPSLVGTDINSTNACLATRAVAEKLFMESRLSTLVVQIPMVLGEGDFASRALRKRAMASRCFVFRAASLEQPVYAGDLISAIKLDVERFMSGADVPEQLLALVGPESLRRDQLTHRAAAVLRTRTTVISLPLGIGMMLAWTLEKLSTSPPVTRAMLQVLDHDDNMDPEPASRALGIELTPLDEMLERTLVAAPNKE
jgi:uncharacterized protein YbjT (DUF2867 family)